ncbi:MAG: maltose alpha-D-glucosyltransferase [Candidatus Erginobacter occultus]|nr:maltose alpha-D-glucosyltransferase [Candidatus Erginobacter occultus]
MGEDKLWYKDAIFYELHVKGFFDSNNDGVGDFKGVIEKLDYLQDLGIDCLWLLPFYLSPQKDDGYDISDFYKIQPEYGTVKDFKALIRAAHKRNIRVVTDLVMNHTSDQHPWFIESRSSRKSSKRGYYVWSDTDKKYKDARIIFVDTEESNWTYDKTTGQFYWHRFFGHQPDLNYDNPLVQTAMLRVMNHWLRMGLDGFRCDAVPYLFERNGTNCENLSQTHRFLKRMRAKIDEKFEDKVLIAEANQWPSDVLPYFGDGDEFHMAFNFPLMPRIFMALRKESGEPIENIMRQLPSIPEACQWGLFLRNHDELTLEMVTDEERDYMYREYAKNGKMKCNIGIRRRLAPLLDNGRRQIELLNNLLFTLPGSPVIYYGDEIGMGDNIYLGDRNGVRTPMQWDGYRNAGFSRADPAQLYSPVNMDPVYGCQSINVEAQLRTSTSLLSWMKRLIKTRKEHAAVFGRGDLKFVPSWNPKTLSYTRRHQDRIVLIVNNLSRFTQPIELDLREYEGFRPVEMLGGTPFPPIGTLPYFFTVGPHNFFWFDLVPASEQAEQKLRRLQDGDKG